MVAGNFRGCALGSPTQCTELVYDGRPSLFEGAYRFLLPLPNKWIAWPKLSLSDNRVPVELIELGIEARKQKEKEFFRACRTFSRRERSRTGETFGRRVGPSGFR